MQQKILHLPFETVRDKSISTVNKIDNINTELEGEVNEFSDFTRMDLGSKKKQYLQRI